MNWIANATVDTNGKISGTDIEHLQTVDRTPAGNHVLPNQRRPAFQDETRVPFRNARLHRPHGVSFRTPRVPAWNGRHVTAPIFRDISRSLRLAHGLLLRTPVNARSQAATPNEESNHDQESRTCNC